MMSKSYIKEAEKNVISQAKFWTEFISFIEGMSHGINDKLESRTARDKFAEGLNKLREAARDEQQFALARCFALVGVGGEEAEEFSKERAKLLFGGKYSTMQWLDEWNRLPSSWMTAEEEAFEKELQDKLKDK